MSPSLASPETNGPRGEWVVDSASHRVVRLTRPHRAARQEYPEPEEQPRQEKREVSLKDLNPIEDLKGAKKLLENVHPLRAVKEALTEGAEFLDPAESDVRVVEPEPDTASDSVTESAPQQRRPEDAHPMPDAKELEGEHRGY